MSQPKGNWMQIGEEGIQNLLMNVQFINSKEHLSRIGRTQQSL